MKKEEYRRKTTFEKKIGSRLGSAWSPGSWVDHVLPGCAGRSFNKLGPVQPPGRLGSKLTWQAGPGLITVTMTS
jgi:hypothetical protein